MERLPRDGDLNSVQFAAESLAVRLIMTGGDTADICQAVHLRARAIWAMFARAQWTSYEAWLPTREENIVFKGTGPTSETHVDRWKEGFACAALVADEYVLENLAKVPIDIMRASSSRHDEHAYLHVEAIQAYLKVERNAFDLVLRAMKATAPRRLKINPEYCLRICVSEIQLLGLLMSGDDFNEPLAQALDMHKRYWGNPAVPDRALMSEGLFPVHLAALAKLAKAEHGYPVTVTSDYLPAEIIAGACGKSME